MSCRRGAALSVASRCRASVDAWIQPVLSQWAAPRRPSCGAVFSGSRAPTVPLGSTGGWGTAELIGARAPPMGARWLQMGIASLEVESGLGNVRLYGTASQSDGAGKAPRYNQPHGQVNKKEKGTVPSKEQQFRTRRFIDHTTLVARAGHGGNGCTSFWKKMGKGRRTKGPDGGNGGHGGSVILRASSHAQCLGSLQAGVNAQHGVHGQSSGMDGRNGKNTIVQVPVGTLVFLEEAFEEEEIDPDDDDPSRPGWPFKPLLDPDLSKHDDLLLAAAAKGERYTPQPISGEADTCDSNWVQYSDDVSSSEHEGEDSDDEESDGERSDCPNEARRSDDSSTKKEEAEGSNDDRQRGTSDPPLWAAKEPTGPKLTLLADLSEEGQTLTVARGGRAGLGNRVLGSKPGKWMVEGQKGGRGVESRLQLELKVVADVGLVGAPNAGKSTLLGAITRAQPEVAAYPFTTLRPFVGALMFDDLSRVVLADIPGLIEGAHANKGLGHKFLKHVERCKALILIVDAAQPAPDKGLLTLLRELDLYQEGLSARAAVVVANKMDLPEAHDGLARLRACTALPVVQCAAKHGNGMDDVSKALARFAQPY